MKMFRERFLFNRKKGRKRQKRIKFAQRLLVVELVECHEKKEINSKSIINNFTVFQLLGIPF